MKFVFFTVAFVAVIFTAHGQKIDTTDNKIYTAVKHEPEFPGGTTGLMKYLTKVQIPNNENEDFQGSFLFEMVIEKDGSVSNVKKLRRTPNTTAGKVFIKLLMASPKWKPGLQEGKPVRVKYFIPLHF